MRDRIKCFTGIKIFSISCIPFTCSLCNRIARTEQVCLAPRIPWQSRRAELLCHGPVGVPRPECSCQLRDRWICHCPGLLLVPVPSLGTEGLQVALLVLNGAPEAGAGSCEQSLGAWSVFPAQERGTEGVSDPSPLRSHRLCLCCRSLSLTLGDLQDTAQVSLTGASALSAHFFPL